MALLQTSKRLAVMPVVLVLVIFFYGCNSGAGNSADTLDAAGFQAFYGSNIPVVFAKTGSGSGAKLIIDYTFPKTDQHQHYHVVIDFSPGGTLLNQSDFERAAKESSLAGSHEQHEYFFPKIGTRARFFFLGAGPGGAAEKLIFTTSDKRWDVSVVVSQLFPENVPPPDKNIFAIAQYIDTSIMQGYLP